MANASTANLNASRRWYLVNAQTGREPLADEHLRRQGFQTFLPCTWRSIWHARKIQTERSAYFPGYLFVSLDLSRDRWRSIDGTIGVLRIIKANERPLPAPVGLVEALQGATGADGALDLARTLRPGEPARIIRGPFADQLVVVERMSAAGRVEVLLSLMHNTVPLLVRRDDLSVM